MLDAVQSEQVERGDIDPEMREQIENEVKEEMPTGTGSAWRKTDQMEEIKNRIDEFKENPYISEQDELRAENIVNARAPKGDSPRDIKERAAIKAQVYDDLLDQKETRFRLNSEGYRAARSALAEQFPYYIQPAYTPAKDAEKKIDPEKDQGYVEPGRVRPTAASAGLYGTAGKAKSGKFSAAQADYQGTRAVARGGSKEVGGAHIEEPPKKEPGQKGKDELTDRERRSAASAKIAQKQAIWTTAQKIQQVMGLAEDKDQFAEQINMNEDDFDSDTKFEAFNVLAQQLFKVKKDPTLQREWETAIGDRQAKPWTRAQALTYSKFPATFEDRAYLPGAEKRHVTRELDQIDRASGESPLHGRPFSALSETEHQELHTAFKKMVAKLDAVPGKLDPSELEEIGFKPNSVGLRGLTGDREKVIDRMELQQKARALTKGMKDEDRAARVPRQVVHNSTKTQRSTTSPPRRR